jgi:uncharacterized protein YycO
MQHITVIYARAPKPISWAIRFTTWSQWSHIGVVSEDGSKVYESRGDTGVVETPINDFLWRYTEYAFAQLPCESKCKAYRFYQSQLGKPYDFTALYSIVFRRDWQEPDSWFCSEYVGAGLGIFRTESIKRITPECLWRLSVDEDSIK